MFPLESRILFPLREKVCVICPPNWGICPEAWPGIVLNARFLGRSAGCNPDANLAMPLKDVKKSQIANTWGAPRGEGRSHEGQDIFAPKGTPVLSATTGYVVKIGEDNLGGRVVSVIGDGGRKYYYAHLDSFAPNLEVGDFVTRKTVLGYVGTTGNADGTPPHLHFGIYTTSGAINPLPLLTDRPQEKPVEPKPDKKKLRRR